MGSPSSAGAACRRRVGRSGRSPERDRQRDSRSERIPRLQRSSRRHPADDRADPRRLSDRGPAPRIDLRFGGDVEREVVVQKTPENFAFHFPERRSRDRRETATSTRTHARDVPTLWNAESVTRFDHDTGRSELNL